MAIGCLRIGVRSASVAIIALAITGQALAAELPDWSGIWRVHGSFAVISSEQGDRLDPTTRNYPPLKPEHEAEYTSNVARAHPKEGPNAKDALTDTNTLNCFPGMPRLVATPFPYEFVITPKKVFIIVDKAVRQVFMDGRAWPEEDSRWPLMMGLSKGRWEGDTLVIDTISMNPTMWTDPTALMLSEQATMRERIRRVSPTQLENRITISDPVKFTKDWSFIRRYDLRPGGDKEWSYDPELCGGPTDRNPLVNGRLTLTPLPGE